MLRVAIAVDSYELPAWQMRAVEAIRGLDGAEVACVFLCDSPPGPARPWLFDLYTRLDARLFQDGKDAFATRDVRKLLGDVAAHADDLDVVLQLGRSGPAGVAARHGVWTLPDAAGGAHEVLRGEETTPARLVVDGRVAVHAHAPTDHISITRNRSNNCWKMASFPARALRDPAALQGGEPAAPVRPPPGNLALLGLLARLCGRYLKKKLHYLLTLEQWYVAYRLDSEPRPPEEMFQGLTPLVPPRDRFWADPFPFRKDGRLYLFVEELLYAEGRGHIAVMEVDPESGAQEPRKVLARGYHLSYPQVFSWEGETYMLPETAGARKVQLFRCQEFPQKWTEDRVFLDGVDAVDATLFEHGGRWWMFANIAEPGAGNWDELHLFHADTPLGPWTPHPQNPVKSDCRSARPAGRPFLHGGDLYRPAQNCAGTYGRAIALNRVIELTPDRYREEYLRDMVPDWAARAHTINVWRGLHVVDLMHHPRRRF